MLRLNNKVAIVTGGATGIGEAISKKFAKEGALVIVNGYPEDPVNQVVDEIIKDGGKAVAFVADISIEENAKECVEFAKRMYGKLDILINNAGTFPEMKEIDKFPTEAFDYMLKNNIKSAFLMTKYAIPELQQTQGCIVSAGSESGELGLAKNTPYGGTKGFMHAFIKGVAVEQAQYGVRANCVCPGAIDTAWTRRSEGPMKREDEKMLISATPLGRRGTPEEVANVYLFLASEEASYVTGALYYVDGGVTVAKGPIGKKAKSKVTEEPEGDLDLEHSMDGATDMRRGN
ncbi:SDR family NAD(P)-dependent oxidoreductase [Chryseosolibacter indicus]|uniref:SDR family oxidoreductase n=1 Tax=Chryseosolibacter indicus TaxID=2782351 RepID=A0ABS5VS53_9BACT|nr:SDR family NAD(P)-dependent oxidoreductase [Chryseosolibacter indicus]MBT1702841.1 SDR family oxidoreductase [Chryseosolibacter indicus]